MALSDSMDPSQVWLLTTGFPLFLSVSSSISLHNAQADLFLSLPFVPTYLHIVMLKAGYEDSVLLDVYSLPMWHGFGWVYEYLPTPRPVLRGMAVNRSLDVS